MYLLLKKSPPIFFLLSSVGCLSSTVDNNIYRVWSFIEGYLLYLGLCPSTAICPGSVMRGKDNWRRQGVGWRWGCLRVIGDACEPPEGRAEMDGGILENRDSCSLISSSINTWTSAAPWTYVDTVKGTCHAHFKVYIWVYFI